MTPEESRLFVKHLVEKTGLVCEIISLRVEASNRRYYRLMFGDQDSEELKSLLSNSLSFQFKKRFHFLFANPVLCHDESIENFADSDTWRIGNYLSNSRELAQGHS